MVNNYLKVKFVSFENKEDIPANAANIEIIVKKEQFSNFDFPSSVADSIEKSFAKKENKVVLAHGEERNFLVTTPKMELEALRLVGASVFASLKKEEVSNAAINGLAGLSDKERYAFLEGLFLSSYDFNKYKKKKNEEINTIYIASKDFSVQNLAELQTLVEVVSMTKSLVNEPLNYLDALKFSELATEAGKKYGFETEILHKEKIQELKMGGLLSVNLGSDTPPTFNVFHYKPKNAINKKPLVIVGKGVMFDTGGYSLKVGGSMPGMKSDMAGGAAVVGLLSAVAGNKLPYHIIGLVPATDNKISGNALVVDDVITMMDGTTVEVLNTDAEGRLVLGDALTYAKQFDPELVIDIATLTGASAAITGSFGIAMTGTDENAINALKTTGDVVYERLLQLPLWEEYADLLKSDIADLKNIGGPTGGVSTSSKFLQHFTDYPWVHLDIAGAAFISDAKGYKQSGGTGVSVRLIYEFIKNKCS
ncbi:leucyl aminopeptidase family protein [Flavobacterium ardleyense]|uniref:Leucyl aminopeptidase family protein n=1 Tax=Flavobacterium ardleyense TaxID=2038737 RepID=A0ABW5Z9Z7_9FLAO